MTRDFLAQSGIDRIGIEIHSPPEAFSPQGVKNVKKMLADFEKSCDPTKKVHFRRTFHFPWIPYEDFVLGDLDEKKRSRTIALLKQGAEYAQALDIRVVNTHLNTTCTDQQWYDFFHLEGTRQTILNNCVDALRQVIPEYERRGISLSIENCPYPFESIDRVPPISPYMGVVRQDFAEIFEQVHSPALTYCFDFLHANILASTAREFVAGNYPISTYWGIYPSQEPDFRRIASEGMLYQLRGFERWTNHVHLGGQLGSYRPGHNTVVEGSVLDLSDGPLVESYKKALFVIDQNSTAPEISTVLEVKEEDYHHSRLLLPSLLACWDLLQQI